MSVEQFDVVDVKESGHVVLTISDHLDWSNSEEHQTILQAKLNKYLAFVESGQARSCSAHRISRVDGRRSFAPLEIRRPSQR